MGEEGDGWPVNGVSPTGGGDRYIHPGAISAEGVLAVQPGRGGGPVSLLAICPALRHLRLKLLNTVITNLPIFII